MADRGEVLKLLQAHLDRTVDTHEAAMTTATIAFVLAHENCLLRSCVPGHLTGSAWIVSPKRDRVLLTHHLKLDKWLQLGGHADGDPDLARVAWREAQEESGLGRVRLVSPQIFDLDRHLIPARKQDPEHYHYDLRFFFEADPGEPLTVSSESKDLAWVELEQVVALNPEESMARMVRKTAAAKDPS